MGNFTLITFVTHIADTMPSLIRLATAISYVLGMYLLVKGIVGFTRLPPAGESDPPTKLSNILITLAVGASLMYLPSVFRVGFSTFWGNTQPYAYLPTELGNAWYQSIKPLLLIIKLVGVIAVIRGLLAFNSPPSDKAPVPFVRGITLLGSGICCINLDVFIDTLIN